uniref:Uncharacterized protein n=1 Tax=Trypanosoma vivax (strain Y486) TaxID=1055687 RepID=G0TZZ6_TRYVY|nr:conserved hypothetical protein [Trypanosoma vivax Y486]
MGSPPPHPATALHSNPPAQESNVETPKTRWHKPDVLTFIDVGASTTAPIGAVVTGDGNEPLVSQNKVIKRTTVPIDFRKNMMDLLSVIYDTRDVSDDKPLPQASTSRHAAKKANDSLFTVTRDNGVKKGMAYEETGPSGGFNFSVAKHATTHVGFLTDRTRILSRVPAGQSFTGDKLDTLLENIVEGYKRLIQKSRVPLRGHGTLRGDANSVSRFVTHAVDNYIAREASFSMADSRSNLSILSAGCDSFFKDLLSFRASSEVADVEEVSETLVKPNFVPHMPTFTREPADSFNVSRSMPLKGTVPPVQASDSLPTEPKGQYMRSMSETLISTANDAGNLGNGGMMPLTCKGGLDMSLDSHAVHASTSDSWNCPGNADADADADVEDVLSSVTEASPLDGSQKVVGVLDSKIARLVGTEKFNRSVLAAVECRFRTYLSTLWKESLESGTPLTVMAPVDEVRSPTINMGLLGHMGETTASPMVQNIIDFFTN